MGAHSIMANTLVDGTERATKPGIENDFDTKGNGH